MAMMKATEEMIKAHAKGEETPPMEIVHEVVIGPEQGEVALSDATDRILVIECKIDGDTVPFNFDPTRGTLDLPEHLQGKPVEVTYTTTVKNPDTLQRVYQSIRSAEINRLAREEYLEAWEQAKQDIAPTLAPIPDMDEALVIGHTEGGPYRSAKIVKYNPEIEPKLPWYKRLWRWLTKCRRATWA